MLKTLGLFTAALALSAASVRADFTGFTVVRSAIDGVDADYRVMMVYANFDSPTDRLLYIYNTRLEVTGSTMPRLLQASSVEDEIPASFAPLGFPMLGEQWLVDSYITIGAEQGTFGNGTVLDPDFDDEGASSGLGIARGGWYNLPPTNGFGLAGDDGRVLIGQFTILESEFAPDAAVSLSATLAIGGGPTLRYAYPAETWAFDGTAVAAEYCVDDHDGDRRSDLMLYQPTTRRMVGWLLQDQTIKQSGEYAPPGPSGARVHGIGDADGDGLADVLWRHPTSGQIHIGLVSGLDAAAPALVHQASASWKTLAFTDIDGDLRADILFFHAGLARVAAWTLDGSTRLGSEVLGQFPGAVPIAIADLDSDGRSDILWRAGNGSLWIWFLNGLGAPRVEQIPGATNASSWGLAAAADFDGDGNADLLWRSKTTGGVCVWKMQGSTRLSSHTIAGSQPTAWRPEASPDTDGDGKHEVVWRHRTSGAMTMWRFGDFPARTVHALPSTGSSWQVGSIGEVIVR